MGVRSTPLYILSSDKERHGKGQARLYRTEYIGDIIMNGSSRNYGCLNFIGDVVMTLPNRWVLAHLGLRPGNEEPMTWPRISS